MGDVSAAEAVLDCMWLLKIAKRATACEDCFSTTMEKGEAYYLMMAQFSYDDSAPTRSNKPVCRACFESRRQLLGEMLRIGSA